ncbi:Uncharacterised protein [Yersinia rohdei]|uniref:Uncharacterized protein n=1 Tax=Yersinia rohdei TaxID=29485 RepID=A0A0U1HY86_YERRO|nr:Uncharacterised protein [Yersinia rohdei]CQI97348.1 Uncharacterised protein [Yersinia rohdei]CQJ62121.1 Uncharacterised protein [Yersinia rohdei]
MLPSVILLMVKISSPLPVVIEVTWAPFWMVTLLLPSPRLIAPLLCEALPNTKLSLPEPAVNVPFKIPLLLMVFAAVPANVTAPLMVLLFVSVFAVVPVKLIAVAPVALIWVLAPIVVSAEAPSDTFSPVPALPSILIFR